MVRGDTSKNQAKTNQIIINHPVRHRLTYLYIVIYQSALNLSLKSMHI